MLLSNVSLRVRTCLEKVRTYRCAFTIHTFSITMNSSFPWRPLEVKNAISIFTRLPLDGVGGHLTLVRDKK